MNLNLISLGRLPAATSGQAVNTKLLKSKPFKDFLVLATGSFGAQAISLIFYPILVRYYSPSEFGVFGVATSIIVICSIFTSGQFHLAFIKSKSKKEVSNLLWLFWVYSLLGALLATVLVGFINFYKDFFPMITLIGFPIFLLGYKAFESHKFLAIQAQDFKTLSQATGINRFVSNLLKWIIGIFSPTFLSLLVSDLFANILSVFQVRKKVMVRPTKPEDAHKFFLQFLHYPFFAALSNFFQLGLSEFPLIVLAIYHNESFIGLYALGMRLALQPVTIFGNSLGSIISKKLVDNHSTQGSSRKLILKFYSLYLLFGIIAVIFAILIPETWLNFVLGERWTGFKEVLIPITLLTTAKMSSSLHIFYYIAIDGIKQKSIWKAFQLCTVLTLIILNQDKQFLDVLWIICIAEASIDLIFTLYTVIKNPIAENLATQVRD